MKMLFAFLCLLITMSSAQTAWDVTCDSEQECKEDDLRGANILCSDHQSCEKTSITVENGFLLCSGEQSCKDSEIECTDVCVVECSGYQSCNPIKRLTCGGSGCCSHICNGNQACDFENTSGCWVSSQRASQSECTCAEYRNGATMFDKHVCIGPAESWGRPCYPMDNGCPSDMSYCQSHRPSEIEGMDCSCVEYFEGADESTQNVCARISDTGRPGLQCYPMGNGGCDGDLTYCSTHQSEVGYWVVVGNQNYASSLDLTPQCLLPTSINSVKSYSDFYSTLGMTCCDLDGSDASRRPCVYSPDYYTALSTCDSRGQRLCTREELENNMGKGTGCSHDNRMIWSSTPCDSPPTSTPTVSPSKQPALWYYDLCTPCGADDLNNANSDCTTVSTQEWCNERCYGGVNDPTLCPTTHCACVEHTTAPRVGCSPCVYGDPGCTHHNTVSQEWCDERCTEGVNTALCPTSHCYCFSREPEMMLLIESTAGYCSDSCECVEYARGMDLSECIFSCEDNPDCLAAEYNDQGNMECKHCPVECGELESSAEYTYTWSDFSSSDVTLTTYCTEQEAFLCCQPNGDTPNAYMMRICGENDRQYNGNSNSGEVGSYTACLSACGYQTDCPNDDFDGYELIMTEQFYSRGSTSSVGVYPIYGDNCVNDCNSNANGECWGISIVPTANGCYHYLDGDPSDGTLVSREGAKVYRKCAETSSGSQSSHHWCYVHSQTVTEAPTNPEREPEMILVVDDTAGHCSNSCDCVKVSDGIPLKDCLISCEDDPSCLAAEYYTGSKMECEHCPVHCSTISSGSKHWCYVHPQTENTVIPEREPSMILVVEDTAGHCDNSCDCEKVSKEISLRDCLISCEDDPSCLSAQHHDQGKMECEHCPVECAEISGGSHHWCYVHERPVATTEAPGDICDSCPGFTTEPGVAFSGSAIFTSTANDWQACMTSALGWNWCVGASWDAGSGSCSFYSYIAGTVSNADVTSGRKCEDVSECAEATEAPDCVDVMGTSCASYASQCSVPGFASWLASNCAKTCNFCDTEMPSSMPSKGPSQSPLAIADLGCVDDPYNAVSLLQQDCNTLITSGEWQCESQMEFSHPFYGSWTNYVWQMCPVSCQRCVCTTSDAHCENCKCNGASNQDAVPSMDLHGCAVYANSRGFQWFSMRVSNCFVASEEDCVDLRETNTQNPWFVYDTSCEVASTCHQSCTTEQCQMCDDSEPYICTAGSSEGQCASDPGFWPEAFSQSSPQCTSCCDRSLCEFAPTIQPSSYSLCEQEDDFGHVCGRWGDHTVSCNVGRCCSQHGHCGTGADYCNSNEQEEFSNGRCPLDPSQFPTRGPTAAPDEYELLGTGFCRPPDCDVTVPFCRTNGYWKDEVTDDECRAICDNDPRCVGYASSSPTYYYPNRCYIHGSHVATEVPAGWNDFMYDYNTVGQVSNHNGVTCYRRRDNVSGYVWKGFGQCVIEGSDIEGCSGTHTSFTSDDACSKICNQHADCKGFARREATCDLYMDPDDCESLSGNNDISWARKSGAFPENEFAGDDSSEYEGCWQRNWVFSLLPSKELIASNNGQSGLVCGQDFDADYLPFFCQGLGLEMTDSATFKRAPATDLLWTEFRCNTPISTLYDCRWEIDHSCDESVKVYCDCDETCGCGYQSVLANLESPTMEWTTQNDITGCQEECDEREGCIGFEYSSSPLTGAAHECRTFVGGFENIHDFIEAGFTTCLKDEYATSSTSEPTYHLAVRLVDGEVSDDGVAYTGRVEVLWDQVWGGVCEDSWDITDSQTVCRMMGLYGGHPVTDGRYGSPESNVFWLDEVACLPGEENIFNCNNVGWGSHNCQDVDGNNIKNFAGVICDLVETTLPDIETTLLNVCEMYPCASGETDAICTTTLLSLSCEGDEDRVETGFMEQGTTKTIVQIPYGTNNLMIRTMADADIDLQLMDESQEIQGSVYCLAGYNCLWAPPYNANDDDKIYTIVHSNQVMNLYFSGDDYWPDDGNNITEEIRIDRVIVPLVLYVNAYEDCSGWVSYSWESVSPCGEADETDRLCSCPAGYAYHDDNGCVDMDACQSHPCPNEGNRTSCTDLPPPAGLTELGRECNCDFGWTGSVPTCQFSPDGSVDIEFEVTQLTQEDLTVSYTVINPDLIAPNGLIYLFIDIAEATYTVDEVIQEANVDAPGSAIIRQIDALPHKHTTRFDFTEGLDYNLHMAVDYDGDGTRAVLRSSRIRLESNPTTTPSIGPTASSPSSSPTVSAPTDNPTQAPTTDTPSTDPSIAPTSDSPTAIPSDNPSVSPSISPTADSPSKNPSISPTTDTPTNSPSKSPTSDSPSKNPSVQPSFSPTEQCLNAGKIDPSAIVISGSGPFSLENILDGDETQCGGVRSRSDAESDSVSAIRFDLSGYVIVDSGTCESNGHVSILEFSDCLLAATALELSPRTMDEFPLEERPTGCVWNEWGTVDLYPNGLHECNSFGYSACLCKRNPRLVSIRLWGPANLAITANDAMDVYVGHNGEQYNDNELVASNAFLTDDGLTISVDRRAAYVWVVKAWHTMELCEAEFWACDIHSDELVITTDNPQGCPNDDYEGYELVLSEQFYQGTTGVYPINWDHCLNECNSNVNGECWGFTIVPTANGCYHYVDGDPSDNTVVSRNGAKVYQKCAEASPEYNFQEYERNACGGGANSDIIILMQGDSEWDSFILYCQTQCCARSDCVGISTNEDTGVCRLKRAAVIEDNGLESCWLKGTPSSSPTSSPVTSVPTRDPSNSPTLVPTTTDPSIAPTKDPTISPSIAPSLDPSATNPSVDPTRMPSQNPSTIPTSDPSQSPTISPSAEDPTTNPSMNPLVSSPTVDPSVSPSESPSNTNPSLSPSKTPSKSPSTDPSVSPFTASPSKSPSISPTNIPSLHPSAANPSVDPSISPTTDAPSLMPSQNPSTIPTSDPSQAPTISPSAEDPTKNPSMSPLVSSPTVDPTVSPSESPSNTDPSLSPSKTPSKSPSTDPTSSPFTSNPSFSPVTASPSKSPSKSPSPNPSESPTVDPSLNPSKEPSLTPSNSPTSSPLSSEPSTSPSTSPSDSPVSSNPTRSPSMSPQTSTPTLAPHSSSPSLSPETSTPSTSPQTSSPSPYPTVNCSILLLQSDSDAFYYFVAEGLVNEYSWWQRCKGCAAVLHILDYWLLTYRGRSLRMTSWDSIPPSGTWLSESDKEFEIDIQCVDSTPSPTELPTSTLPTTQPSKGPVVAVPTTSPQSSAPSQGPSEIPSPFPSVTQPSSSPTMSITCIEIDFRCDTEFDGSYAFIESRQSWISTSGEVYSTTWPDSLTDLSGRRWVFSTHSRNDVLVSDKWLASYPTRNRWFLVDFKTFAIQGEIQCAPEAFICHQTASPSASTPTVSPSKAPVVSDPSLSPTFDSPSKAPQTKAPSITPSASDPTTSPHSSAPSSNPSENPLTSPPSQSPTKAPDTASPSENPSYRDNYCTGIIVSGAVTSLRTNFDGPYTMVAGVVVQSKPTWLSRNGEIKIFLTKMVSTGMSRWVISDRSGYFSTEASFEDSFPPASATWNFLAAGEFDDSFEQQITIKCVDTGAPTTSIPTQEPSKSPSPVNPTSNPITASPSTSPHSSSPSEAPQSSAPSGFPSEIPTAENPTTSPSTQPSLGPQISKPTGTPSKTPIASDPSTSPTQRPQSSFPSSGPSVSPIASDPSVEPTDSPQASSPTTGPSRAPQSSAPSTSPSSLPSSTPTEIPSKDPSYNRFYCTQATVTGTTLALNGMSEEVSYDGEYLLSYSEQGRRWTRSDREVSLFRTDIAAARSERWIITGSAGYLSTEMTESSDTYPPHLARWSFFQNGRFDEIPIIAVEINCHDTVSPTTALPSRYPSSTFPSQSPESSSPSASPSSSPVSSAPTATPTNVPSRSPLTSTPTKTPTLLPTSDSPTLDPSKAPHSSAPSSYPSDVPSSTPSRVPSSTPTKSPESSDPTYLPSLSPTSATPTLDPSQAPHSSAPSGTPSKTPTIDPSKSPSEIPSKSPESSSPTDLPSISPTLSTPTLDPSQAPHSSAPSINPSKSPSGTPSKSPESSSPTEIPSNPPTSDSPTVDPSQAPHSSSPSGYPSKNPTSTPSKLPTVRPSTSPESSLPTVSPSNSPTSDSPSLDPSQAPHSSSPSGSPSKTPTATPSKSPSDSPTQSPQSSSPTVSPSKGPTLSFPSDSPHSSSPSRGPSISPSSEPSTSEPTMRDRTKSPTMSSPTASPSYTPETILPVAIDFTSTRLGFPATETYSLGDNTFGRTFTSLFSEVPSGVSLSGYVNNEQFGSETGRLRREKQYATNLEMLLLTPEVYEDSNEIRISFQASTSSHSTVVRKTGLTFILSITMDDLVQSTECESINAQTGIALSPCKLPVPTEWFSRISLRGSVSLQMKYNDEVYGEESSTFEMKPIVEIPELAEAGLLVSGIRSPVDPSLTPIISYDVYIHTGGRSLDSWLLQFAFDPSVMHYSSQTTGDLWLEAAPIYDDMEIINAGGVLEIQSRAVEADASSLTGTNLFLLSVSFAVVGNGLAEDCISVTALSLADIRTAVYEEGRISGQIVDLFGTSLSGTLDIRASQPVGLLVASSKTEFVNTAVLNSAPVSTLYQAFHIKDNGEQVSAELNFCEGAGTTVDISGNSCLIAIDANTPSTVTIGLESELYARSVSISVWRPENTRLILDRDVLYRIDGACNLWTPGHASVYVDLRYDTQIIRRVLMTDFVEVYSTDTSVVTVSGRTIQAIMPGEAFITAAGLFTPIQVSSDPISIASLEGSIFTDVEFQPSSRSINYSNRELDDTLETTIRFLQEFNDEFVEGSIFVYARLSDDTLVSVTSENDLMITSSAPSSLNLTSTFKATVPFGAASARGDLLSVSLQNCVGDAIISGSIFADVSLPTATEVLASIDCAEIASATDAAAMYEQFRIPSKCSISVIMSFDDGTEKNVEADPRIRYSSVDNKLVIDDIGQVTVRDNVAGSSSVDISFADWPSSNGLTSQISVRIVLLESIKGTVLPYPSNTGSYSDPTILEQIHCTNTFERAFHKTEAMLSNGDSADVSTDATHTSQDPSIVRIEPDTRYVGSMVIIPLTMGMTTVSSSFYGKSTAETTINVLMSPITITELTLHETAFNGKAGQTQKIQVDIVLSDGTKLDNVQDEPWINLAEIVEFTSNAEDALTIGPDGSMTILGNHHEAVSISANSICSAKQISEITIPMSVVLFSEITDWEPFEEAAAHAIARLIKESSDNISILRVPSGNRRNLQASQNFLVQIRTTQPGNDVTAALTGSGPLDALKASMAEAGYDVALILMTDGALEEIIVLDPITSTVSVYPNILPESWDIDLNAQNSLGLQFPPSVQGDTLILDVKLNADAGRLDAWDIFIRYNPTYVSITGCTVGYDWADKTFEANVDSVPGVAHLGGLGGNDPSKRNVEGFTLTLAHCTMTVISDAPALVDIQTDITELGVFMNNEPSALGASTSVSGSGVLKINNGVQSVSSENRRHLSGTCGHHLFVGSEVCACDNDITGDVSGDCNFNVYDAQAAAYYLSSVEIPGLLSLDELTLFQRQQLDLNLDYLKDPPSPCFLSSHTPPCVNDIGDVGFLIKFAFDKRRVLDPTVQVVSFSETDDLLTIRVKLTRYVSSAIVPATGDDTRVMFEINTARNRHISFNEVTNDPWQSEIEKYVVPASFDGDFFVITSNGPFQTDEIGIAILVEALDTNGAATQDRQYAYGASQYYGSSKFVPYATIQVEGTLSPTATPTVTPTEEPTVPPTCPVCPPIVTCEPTLSPIVAPSSSPSFSVPSLSPVLTPSITPSTLPPTKTPTRPAKGTTREPSIQPSRQPTVNMTGGALIESIVESGDLGFMVGMMTGLAVMFACCCLVYVFFCMRGKTDETMEIDFDAVNRYKAQQLAEEEAKRRQAEEDRRRKELEDGAIAAANPHEEALRRLGEKSMFLMSPSNSAQYELGEDGVYRIRARTMEDGGITGGITGGGTRFIPQMESFTEDGYGGVTGDFETRPSFSQSVISADGYVTGDGDLVTGYDDDSDTAVDGDETGAMYAPLKSGRSETFGDTPRGGTLRDSKGEPSMKKLTTPYAGTRTVSKGYASKVVKSPIKKKAKRFAPHTETNTFTAPSHSVLPDYDPPEFSDDSLSSAQEVGGGFTNESMSRLHSHELSKIFNEEPSNQKLWIASSGNFSHTAMTSASVLETENVEDLNDDEQDQLYQHLRRGSSKAYLKHQKRIAGSQNYEKKKSSKAKRQPQYGGSKQRMWVEEFSQEDLMARPLGGANMGGRRINVDPSFTAEASNESLTAEFEPSVSLTAVTEDPLDIAFNNDTVMRGYDTDSVEFESRSIHEWE